MTGQSVTDQQVGDLRSRHLLSSLGALPGLSVAMAEASPTEILAFAAAAVPWLTCGRARASVSSRPAGDDHDPGWMWTLPVRHGSAGVVIRAPVPLRDDDLAVLQALAVQTGLALDTASRLARERERAAEAARHAHRLRLAERSNERLTEAAATPDGAAAIAQVLSEITGLTVIVEDPYGQPLARFGSDSFTTPSIWPYPSRKQLLQEAAASPTILRNGGLLIAPAVAAGRILGVVFLLDPTGRSRLVHRDALRHAAALLAVWLAANPTATRSESMVAREVVDDLLTGDDRDAAITQAKALIRDIDRARRVVVVESDHAIPEDFFLAVVRRRAETVAVGGICTILSGAVVFLAGETEDWRALHSAIVGDLAVGCRIGIGGLTRDLAQLAVSYHQAQHVLKLQGIVSSTESVALFEELGAYGLLSELDQSVTVEGFMRHWLGSLADYDHRRGGDLVHTLSAYLDHGGSHAGAAAALSIHRSTLRYRLDRIRSIIGHDLSDADVRFNLQLATRVWTTLQALEDAGSSSLP